MAIASSVAVVSSLYWWGGRVDNSNASSDEQVPSPQLDSGADEPHVAALLDAITSHLDPADQTAETVVEECLRGVMNCFHSATAHAPEFADIAVSWTSTSRMIWSALPGTDNDHQVRYLERKFKQLIISEAMLTSAIKSAVTHWNARMQEIESKLLVDIHVDLETLAGADSLPSPSATTLSTRLEGAIRDAMTSSSEHTVALAGELALGGLTTSIVRRILARSAISGGVLSVGAAGSVASLGLSLIIGIVVDKIISVCWDWYADPRGALVSALRHRIIDVRDELINGPVNPATGARNGGLRDELTAMTDERSRLRLAAIGSALGFLKHKTESAHSIRSKE